MISIIIPIYNEATNLEILSKKIKSLKIITMRLYLSMMEVMDENLNCFEKK